MPKPPRLEDCNYSGRTTWHTELESVITGLMAKHGNVNMSVQMFVIDQGHMDMF